MNDSYIGEVHWAITCIDFSEGIYAVESPVTYYEDWESEPEQGFAKIMEGTIYECLSFLKSIYDLEKEIEDDG